MDDFQAFGSRGYWVFFAILLFARGMDFLSTWLATPNLVLEANPIARGLGWKFSALLNLALCGLFAFWPLPAIVIATTSVLVAARNFQSAWLMRTMGEEAYRAHMVERLRQAPFGLYLFCLFTQSILVGAVGAALMIFSGMMLVPFAVGAGMATYALAITFYSLLAARRCRKD